MGGLGGIKVKEGLKDLEQALLDYYGALNELRMLQEVSVGNTGTVKIPEKPEALQLWEMCEAVGLPLFGGGLMDQPHIWLEELAVVRKIQEMFKQVKK